MTVMSCASDLGKEKSNISRSPRWIPCRQAPERFQGMWWEKPFGSAAPSHHPDLVLYVTFQFPRGKYQCQYDFVGYSPAGVGPRTTGDITYALLAPAAFPRAPPWQDWWFHPSGTQWQGEQVKHWPWDYTSKLHEHTQTKKWKVDLWGQKTEHTCTWNFSVSSSLRWQVQCRVHQQTASAWIFPLSCLFLLPPHSRVAPHIEI